MPTFRLALAGCVLLPAVAAAQPISGLYVGGGAGANFAPSMLSSQNNTQINTNPGPVAVVSLGWGFGNGIRMEVEGNYRSNGVSSIQTLRVNRSLEPLSNVNGTMQTYGVMVNGFYDIPFQPFGMVKPYIGAGVGYGWLHLGNTTGNGFATFRLPGNNTFGPAAETVSFGTAGAFAYQVIAGAAIPLNFVPGLDATLEYRFYGTTQANVPTTRVADTTNTVNGVIPSATTQNGFSLANHAVLVGLRYSFAPAPPPLAPVAAPAPIVAPARSYLVFFDWDKATLSDRSRQIIADAATNSTKVQYTRIDVSGYTDTTGLPRYNQALSERRAQAVAAELVKDGVPQTAISVQGFGDRHLLVPTGPGIREAQNRRVEIVIH